MNNCMAKDCNKEAAIKYRIEGMNEWCYACEYHKMAIYNERDEGYNIEIVRIVHNYDVNILPCGFGARFEIDGVTIKLMRHDILDWLETSRINEDYRDINFYWSGETYSICWEHLIDILQLSMSKERNNCKRKKLSLNEKR